MGYPVKVLLSVALGLLCVSSARADETAKKIQAALKKIEGSVVGVRYSRDVEGLMEGAGGRSGRGMRWMRTLGGPRLTTGVVTNSAGMIAVPAEITRDPTRGWGGMGGAPTPPGIKELTVIFAGGEERKAHLAGRDSKRNLAFIQLEDSTGVKPIRFSSKRDVSIAEEVIIVAPLSDREAGTQRFLLTRINAIVEGDAACYSVMDDLGPYEGGVATTLNGDVIGIVGRPPVPETEGEEILGVARRWMGGRAQGLRILPAGSVEGIFAKPPTGLLPLEGEKKAEGDEKKPGEEEKKPEKKPEEKPDEDY